MLLSMVCITDRETLAVSMALVSSCGSQVVCCMLVIPLLPVNHLCAVLRAVFVIWQGYGPDAPRPHNFGGPLQQLALLWSDHLPSMLELHQDVLWYGCARDLPVAFMHAVHPLCKLHYCCLPDLRGCCFLRLFLYAGLLISML